MDWISVKDKLPNKNQMIDIWDYENKRRITDFYYTRYGFIGYRVSHWMPSLDPPPKE